MGRTRRIARLFGFARHRGQSSQLDGDYWVSIPSQTGERKTPLARGSFGLIYCAT